MPHTEPEIAKLKDFDNRLASMLTFLEGKQTLTHFEKQDLQQQLTNLKRDMKMEAKCKSNISSIVNEAVCRIQVATNTHPINSNWFSDLYSARADIRFAIHRNEGSKSE